MLPNSDGSPYLLKNVPLDTNKFNLIHESLIALTDPQKINEMIEKLRGILDDKDIEKVKDIIYKQPDQNPDLQHDQQQDRTM